MSTSSSLCAIAAVELRENPSTDTKSRVSSSRLGRRMKIVFVRDGADVAAAGREIDPSANGAAFAASRAVTTTRSISESASITKSRRVGSPAHAKNVANIDARNRSGETPRQFSISF
jgi:hypothetical protein